MLDKIKRKAQDNIELVNFTDGKSSKITWGVKGTKRTKGEKGPDCEWRLLELFESEAGDIEISDEHDDTVEIDGHDVDGYI